MFRTAQTLKILNCTAQHLSLLGCDFKLACMTRHKLMLSITDRLSVFSKLWKQLDCSSEPKHCSGWCKHPLKTAQLVVVRFTPKKSFRKLKCKVCRVLVEKCNEKTDVQPDVQFVPFPSKKFQHKAAFSQGVEGMCLIRFPARQQWGVQLDFPKLLGSSFSKSARGADCPCGNLREACGTIPCKYGIEKEKKRKTTYAEEALPTSIKEKETHWLRHRGTTLCKMSKSLNWPTLPDMLYFMFLSRI
eukprot:714385-Pelagomonas_calceolata.AAC.1